jgi:hypothetical protein
LSHDEGNVFRESIENHKNPDPKGVPEEEKGGKENGCPMGELCPTGFAVKCPQVGRVFIVEPFFGETTAPQKRSAVREIGFPFLNLEDPVIETPVPFPLSNFEKPCIRVETGDRNSNHEIDHTYMNDKPCQEIDDDSPGGGKMDQAHGSIFFSEGS